MSINYICTSNRETDRHRIYRLWASSSTGMAGFVLLRTVVFSSRNEEK